MDLTQRFMNGLAEYDMTEEDIKKWRWCGGTANPSDYDYWTKCFPDCSPPDTEERCICGQKIAIQNWITNGEEFLVIGSECRHKFLYYRGKTCAMCGEPHKNRKDNHCKTCRKLVIQQEKERVEQERVQRELDAQWAKKHQCACGKEMNMNGTNYTRCYTCFQKNVTYTRSLYDGVTVVHRKMSDYMYDPRLVGGR